VLPAIAISYAAGFDLLSLRRYAIILFADIFAADAASAFFAFDAAFSAHALFF